MASYYGTLDHAADYFSRRLETSPWDQATVQDREKAMYMATAAIDRLNFAGEKYDEDQELQFPRGYDTEVPDAINFACYEEALKLLDGVDVEMEIQSIGVNAEGFTGVRTSYSGDHYVAHILAGIMSYIGWTMLAPYLRDPMSIDFRRSS